MKPTNRVKIIAPNRVHITLLSMEENSYRKNGGIGFSVNIKNLEIEAEKSTEFILIDSKNFLKNSRIEKIISMLEKAKSELNLEFGLKIEVMNAPLEHMGFGSGTSLHLACAEALFLINERSFTQDELIKISGRGGTSGIGINTYFNGGFVFDMGRKNDSKQHLPSSVMSANLEKPLTALSTKMPQWDLGICIPKDISPISEEDEISFFKSTCPIKKRDVEETIYHAILGTIAGVLDQDKSAFCKSINAIQKTKWKNSEIELYGHHQKHLMERLAPWCECVGMSSLGPALYFITNDIETIISTFKDDEALIIEKVTVNNTGREISYV